MDNKQNRPTSSHRDGTFTARDLRQSVRHEIWDRLSATRKRVAGVFVAAAVGAFLIVPSYASNFIPTGERDHGVHGDIQFFPSRNTSSWCQTSSCVPYTDGRITAGYYTMSAANGQQDINGKTTEAVYCVDLSKFHNSGDFLRGLDPAHQINVYNGDLVEYHEIDFILGNWHADNPQGGLNSDEMAGAIQLAIWGESNGIFDNGNTLPRPYNGAGHGIDGGVLAKMVKQAQDIDGYTAAHHADWFLAEAETHTVNISAPVETIQPGQVITATATLQVDGAPDTSPNGAQITFNVSGSGAIITPNPVGVDGGGHATAQIRATGPGTITVNANITPGTDFFAGAQGLYPVTYAADGTATYLTQFQTMAFSVYVQRLSNTPSLNIPVAAPATPPPSTPPPSTPPPTTPTPTPTPTSTPTPTPTPTPPPVCPDHALANVTITGPTTYTPGTAVTYTVVATNSGTIPTRDDVLKITLPQGWTVDSSTSSDPTLTPSDPPATPSATPTASPSPTPSGSDPVVTFDFSNNFVASHSATVTVTATSPTSATDTAIASADFRGVSTESNADPSNPNCLATAKANTQSSPVIGQVQGIQTTSAPELVTPVTGAGGGMLRSLLVGLFLMGAGITVLTGLRRNPHAAI